MGRELGKPVILGLIVFLFAFAIRLSVAHALSGAPLVRTPQLDSLEYLEWARSLAAGDFTWPTPPPHGPAYPFFLAACLFVSGGSVPFVQLAQAILGSLLCVVVMDLGRRFFGKWAGFAAGLAIALYGPLVYVESSLFSEGLLLLLMALAVAVGAAGAGTRARFGAAGVLLGLSALVRPTALVLLAPLGAMAFFREPRQTRWSRCAALILATALTIAPVSFVNWRTGSAGVLIQGFGGFNAYIGNSPNGTGLALGTVGPNWDILEGEARRHGVRQAAAQDRYYEAKTWREIRSRPGSFVRLQARKLFWSIQDDEVRDSHSLYFFRLFSPLLSVLPGFGILFPLALVGLAFPTADRVRPWPILGYFLATLATCVLLVVGMRYRMPLVPTLAVLAGAGIDTGIRCARTKSVGRFAAMAALAAVGFLLSHQWRHAPSHDLSEEWALTGNSLFLEGRTDEAREAYRRSLAINARCGAGWLGMGRIELNEHHLEEAERDARQAILVAPGNAGTHYALGLVEEQKGRWDDAVASFRAALALQPDHVASLDGIGVCRLAQSRWAEAGQAFETAHAIAPRDSRSALGLAHLAGVRRKPEDGIPLALEATRLDPANPDTWLTLGLLAVDAGQLDRAGEALDRAENLGAPKGAVAIARAKLWHARNRPDEVDRVLRDLLQEEPTNGPAASLFLRNAADTGALEEAKRFLNQLVSPPPAAARPPG